EQVARDSVQTERIKAMEATGKVSSAEVAAQQASLEQTRLSSVQARNNLNMALLDLSQLLELESPEGFDVVSPSESMLQPGLLMSPEAVYEQAVTIKPVILSGELAVEQAKITIDRAKGAGLPSLSLSGGIGTNFYTNSLGQSASFGSQLEKNFSQYVGLSLRVPIFQRFSVRNNVKNARIGLINQELQLENARKSLYKEIQQAYYNAVAAQAKCKSSLAAAQSAEQAFVLTREKYDNGKANVTEYNDSRARYLEAQSNYLQARYEAVYQEKLLDFYRGQPLAF
ncbi:MAG: TolC family protein, partial [Bacteroidales bacterium]|nr:TolC family protein [Bacteroidales bacterium]